MKKGGKRAPRKPRDLRERAEARLAERTAAPGAEGAKASADVLALVEELRIHQIELELQNEALARARDELEAALAGYADLYEHAPVGYLTLGRDGRVGRVNLAGARLFGEDRSALVERPLGRLLAKESRAELAAFLAGLGEARDERAPSVVVRLAAEPTRSLELRGTVLVGGQSCRVVVVDVSARRDAERLARMRSQRAQAQVDLFQLSPGPEAAIVDRALGALVALTESELGLIGFVGEGEATLTAHAWSAPAMGERAVVEGPLVFDLRAGGLWATAVRERAPVIVNDCAASGAMAKGLPAEHVALRRFLGVPLVRAGRVVLVAGLANRVAKYGAEDAVETAAFLEGLWEMLVRRRAEGQHLASETKYRTLYESSADAVLLLRGGRVFDCNPAAVRMFGAGDRSQLCGLGLGEFGSPQQPHGSSAAASAEAWMAAAAANGSCQFEWMHRRLDGRESFAADVRLSCMVLDGREALQATVRDTTEHKRMQASLAQADRLASVGLLAAGVAHEINNPLSYVLYNLEVLVTDLPTLGLGAKRCLEAMGAEGCAGASGLRESAFDEAIACAGDALEGTRRIQEIARNLGSFSRVERTERTRVDVRHAVELAVRIAAQEIKYRARLVEELEPVPAVWASEGKLAQVFLNLLLNAAHAVDGGHADAHRITVRTRLDDGHVVVEVSDTGCGIPETDLGRVFEPFFTTKAVGKGAGLGLSICKDLVVAFGGEIGVESQVGRGTTFAVRLPVAAAEAQLAPGASSAAPPAASAAVRILVVDDEPSIRAALTRILAHDHEIVAAASAREAQRVLATDRTFDVVLCDVMMPEMTGVEFHAWLGEEDAALATRLVFMTGGAFTPHASNYLAATPNRTVDKPIDKTQLKALVSEFVVARATG